MFTTRTYRVAACETVATEGVDSHLVRDHRQENIASQARFCVPLPLVMAAITTIVTAGNPLPMTSKPLASVYMIAPFSRLWLRIIHSKTRNRF
ncbi:hypothetical protein CA13_40480 [Planctomycetes bacterium CA13]|uniref:Uncharacterized protein n=1 Tax=Novipirellula herctigrandis TaxID=2527986 RepID=A0A5C5Z5W7_9BACT|nr:hypothetical protein CA13_40480 [Planctomycetes bacterium CA13]